jgi:hypothetical protein
MEVTLKLDVEAVKAMINLMGETQAKQGFFPLMVEVTKQLESQMSQEQAPAA